MTLGFFNSTMGDKLKLRGVRHVEIRHYRGRTSSLTLESSYYLFSLILTDFPRPMFFIRLVFPNFE